MFGPHSESSDMGNMAYYNMAGAFPNNRNVGIAACLQLKMKTAVRNVLETVNIMHCKFMHFA